MMGGMEGTTEVIDFASAPTSWRQRWDEGGAERVWQERYIRLLHLQPYLNLVKRKLQFFLLIYYRLILISSTSFYLSLTLCLLLLIYHIFAFLYCASLSYILSSFFGRNCWCYYPTSPLPGWVRYCGGVYLAVNVKKQKGWKAQQQQESHTGGEFTQHIL